jgi:hypothetical protein
MKDSRCRFFCQKEFAENMVPLLRQIRLAEINLFSATLIDPLSLRRGVIEPISLILANKSISTTGSPAIAGPPFRWPENNLRKSPKIRPTSG